jgi:glycosyltransferase involved in cell wall biosynthesis
MSYGKPAIVTDVGDAALIIGETGMVVPPRDPAKLAQAILHVAGWDVETYRARCADARARILELYSIDNIASLYGQIMSGKPVNYP